jgi:hypothetical protein
MKNNFEQPNRSDQSDQPKNYDEHIEDVDMDAAYKKAQKILDESIDPEGFRDIYGENVDKDMEYVKKMEEMFSKQAMSAEREDGGMGKEADRFSKLAKIFEAIVFQHAELSNWFGEYATTIAASRYDDIKNGIDTIVEFEENQNAYQLALAIDVTTSSGSRSKFDRIQKEIDEGHLAEIKYFVSENMSIHGHKANVPRVVIGADRKTIYNVINAWIEKDNRALAAHPIQIKILSEIQIQLASFKQYCENTGKTDLAGIYEKGLTIVEKIILEKNIAEADMVDLDFDEVYRAIKAQAENVASRGTKR